MPNKVQKEVSHFNKSKIQYFSTDNQQKILQHEASSIQSIIGVLENQTKVNHMKPAVSQKQHFQNSNRGPAAGGLAGQDSFYMQASSLANEVSNYPIQPNHEAIKQKNSVFGAEVPELNRSNNKLEPLKIHSSLYAAKKTFTQLSVK